MPAGTGVLWCVELEGRNVPRFCRPLWSYLAAKTRGSGTFDEQKLVDIVTTSDLAQSTASTAFGI
jgi:hypothetical protein